MTLTSRTNTVATPDDEQVKTGQTAAKAGLTAITGRTANPGGRTAIYSNTGRTAHPGGRTAHPGLSQFLKPGKPKPTGIFKPIELLPGGSKNYETKCSRITLPSYTLYFWPSSKLTEKLWPV